MKTHNFLALVPWKTIRTLTLLITVSAICAILLWYQRILPHTFQAGQPSPYTLYSSEQRTILDIKATEQEELKAKRQALEEFLKEPKLVRDKSQNIESISELKRLTSKLDLYFNFVEEKRPYFLLSDSLTRLMILMPREQLDLLLNGSESEQQLHEGYKPFLAELTKSRHSLGKIKSVTNKLRQELHNSMSDHLPFSLNIWNTGLYKISKEEWFQVKPYLEASASKILTYGYLGYIDEISLREVLREFPNLSSRRLAYLKAILGASLKPNIKVEVETLSRVEDRALMEVKPVWMTVPSHSVIIEKGEKITPQKLAIIEQLGLNRKKIDFNVFGEAFWMTLIVMLSFSLFVRFERFQLSMRKMLLLSFLVIGASAFVGLFVYQTPAAIPLAAVAMTTGLFFKPSVGFSAEILFGILCLQALNIPPSFLIPAFVGAIVATILGQRAKNRADLTYAGIWLAIVQMLAYCFVTLVLKLFVFTSSDLILQGLNGLTTGLLVSSGMPFLEYIFSVVTRFRLLELSDPNQPLLKRLHDEAPGTYEHTLVVADLAQDAAKKIDADYELVRVGILYHDIGKLHEPQIFIENQFGGPNPHELMTPQESAQAIIKHVSEGIEMAKKNRLPEPVRNFIPAHQGNSRAGHFFLKASQLDPNLKDDSEFRYPGPKPNSKETGIAMLADTVEATIRSLRTDDKNLVKETIKNLIEARIKDNQLSDSTLTKAELEKIAESFYESWKNKNHERIRYISDLKK
ncbi:MAG: HDIG domain-containing protein [Candidatus Caenarcaniphilales bacterium]|nr:HDIG domain-containing protein [Candidatus Caenarcaniphilales bacterium]